MDTLQENQERHVLIINNDQRRAFALEAAAYSIGRDVSNAIVLDFETISRQHAMLLRVPIPNSHAYQYRLIDGNAKGKPSANGIYINGERVKSHKLKNGDTVQFGQHVQAAYLTLSMGEAEFVNYLESISFQSLKSEMVDARATRVAMDINAKNANIATIAADSADNTVIAAAETLYDAEFDAQAFSGSDGLNSDQKASTSREKSPLRLWMAAVGGLVAIAAIGAGIFVLTSKPAAEKSLESPTPSPALEDSKPSS